MPAKARSFRLTRPGPVRLTGARVAGLLVGVLACHLLFLGPLTALFLEPPVWLEEAGLHWGNRLEAETKAVWFATAVLLSAALVAAALWRLGRIGQRPADFAAFVFCWWRASIFGSIVLILFLAVTLPWLGPAGEDVIQWTGVVLPVYLAIAPAALSPYQLPMRLHWRPECPECGHTLKYAAAARCSECGEPYPCPDRFYRRWAIRRLAWDRRRRTLVVAYVRTMLCILFRPDVAAWRLANPDRYGRAVRWALGHVLVTVSMGVAAWAAVRFALPVALGAEYPSWNDASADPPYVRLAPLAQAGIVWGLVAVGVPALIGIVLSFAAPRIQPAARSGVIKWSLYSSPAAIVAATPLAVGLGYYWWVNVSSGQRWVVESGEWARMWFRSKPEYMLYWIVVASSLWWAIGVGSQPYLRRRGFHVAALGWVAYQILLHILLAMVDRRGLEGLL